MISVRIIPEFRDELAPEIIEAHGGSTLLSIATDIMEAGPEDLPSNGIDCFDPRDGQRKRTLNPALMLAEIMVRSGRVIDAEGMEKVGQLASYCESDIAKAKGVKPYDGSGYLEVPITGGDFQALLDPEKR